MVGLMHTHLEGLEVMKEVERQGRHYPPIGPVVVLSTNQIREYPTSHTPKFFHNQNTIYVRVTS